MKEFETPRALEIAMLATGLVRVDHYNIDVDGRLRHIQSFGTVLTRDEIEALSDDPATLQQQLQDMAGPGAVIRIDGFEGGALPAKAQIRSIRISRDQFAAEYHNAGGVFIADEGQPGFGRTGAGMWGFARHGVVPGRARS